MYSQNDPRWKDIKMGIWKDDEKADAKETWKVGCLLTCFAQLLTNHERPHTPAELNDVFVARRTYFNNNELPDEALDSWPDVEFLSKTWSPGLNNLKRDPGEEIIIRLITPKHFVIFKDLQKEKVIVADPIDGTVINFADRYGDPRYNMQRLIRYKFTDDLMAAVNWLQKSGIISSPDYWMEHARAGDAVAGESAHSLIIKTAAKLRP
jgi:hypothetical protein